MKTILIIILFISGLFAQYGTYGNYGTYIPTVKKDKTLPTDSYTVGNWIFDTTYHDSIRYDLTTNNNDLSPSAGFDWANQMTGTSPIYVGGNALYFDGTDDAWGINDVQATDFNPGSSDFTLEIWVKLVDNGSIQTLISKKLSTSPYTGYLLRRNADNTIWFVMTDDGVVDHSIQTSSTFLADGWHYIAVTVDRDNASNCHIYVDGVSQSLSTQETTTNTVDSNAWFRIGLLGASYCNAYIAQVRWSNKVRSASEISSYYSQF